MKKQADKPTYEELQRQLQEARTEAKTAKAELRRSKQKTKDLELKVNLLEYLNDPENPEKKSKLSSQWQKIADILEIIHSMRETS